MKPLILALDDAPQALEFYDRVLSEKYEVRRETDARRALERLRREDAELVLTDLIMPDIDGVAFLHELRSFAPEIPVLVISATEDLDQAIAAFREQPFEFLRKPVQAAELQMAVQRALTAAALQRHVEAYEHLLSGAEDEGGLIIGPSPGMKLFWEKVRRIAEHGGDNPVLICGESGTGKELAARAIHRWSPRKSKPLLNVNCGLLDKNLAAAALFGIGRGVATGVDPRIGKFAAAEGGSLFLDEIAELDPAVQVQLLRVLQEKTFSRVGSHQERKADVRVIAATNKDLREAVRTGVFRQDLYYRIGVVTVTIPPLRDHLEDIPALVKHFLHKHGRNERERWRRLISRSLLKTLQGYHWPGNIRQLENVLVNIIITGNPPTLESLRGETLPALGEAASASMISVVGRPWAELEMEIFRLNWEACRGNLNALSKSMEIAKSTLYDKIHRLGLR